MRGCVLVQGREKNSNKILIQLGHSLDEFGVVKFDNSLNFNLIQIQG